MARKAGVAVVVPIFEKRAPGLYHNSAVILDADGRTAGLYRKMHIPDDPSFYEKFYFTPGDLGFRAFDTRFGKIGDAHLLGPVVPGGRAAHRAARRGGPLLPDRDRLAPAREGAARRPPARRVAHHPAQPRHRERLLRRGREPRRPRARAARARPASSSGARSFLCDPFGVVIAEASTDREEILVGEVDVGRIEEVRRGWPFLRDRRIDAYQGIDKRFLE